MLTCNWANSIWIQCRCRHEQRCPECLHYLFIGKLSYWLLGTYTGAASKGIKQFHAYFRCSVMKELQKSIKMSKTLKKIHKETASRPTENIRDIWSNQTKNNWPSTLYLHSVFVCFALFFFCCCCSYWELKQLPESTPCHVFFVHQVFDNLRKNFHLTSNSRTDVCNICGDVVLLPGRHHAHTLGCPIVVKKKKKT